MKRAMMIFDEYRLKPFFANATLHLGRIYLHSEKKQKALQNLQKAEALFREMSMDYWLTRTYAVYTELHMRKGDKPKARDRLSKAIDILKKCGADGWVQKYEGEMAAL